MHPPLPRRSTRRLGRLFAIALVALVALAHLPSDAAGQRLAFRHLTVDDGLPGSQVNDILSDSRGYVWISTAGGLGRYDGYGFQTFRRSRENQWSLPNSHVITTYEDRARILWVGSLSGLSRFDRRTETFASFMLRDESGSLQRRSVQRIFEDRSARLWIGTSQGLFQFDRSTMQARPFELPGAPSADVRDIVQDSTGRLWISTDKTGLYELSTGLAARRHEADPRDANTIPTNDVRGLTVLAGRLWIATSGAGLASLDLATGRIVRYLHDPERPATLASNRLLKVIPERSGGLWVGTENQGVDLLDITSGTFTHHPSSADDPSSLIGTSVGALYEDAAGALWAGTFTGGVSVSRLNGGAIRLFRTAAGNPRSLGGNTVVGFHEDRKGRIWIATDGSGLSMLDRATERFTRYNTSNSGLKSNAVLAIAEDPDGDIWVGSWAGGLTRIRATTGAMTTHTTATSTIPSNDIFSIHLDRAGRLWAGTYRHGLMLIDRGRGTFRTFPIVGDGRLSPLIWRIHELADGRLALATGVEQEGLVVFDPRTERTTSYRSNPRDPGTLSSNTVNALLEQRPGVLWIGTPEGLDRLTLATGGIEHFSTRDGLPGAAVNGIAADRTGKLWVSTDQGVARFDPESRSAKRFTPGDGLQGNEFMARAYMQARDGTIFFGGTNGFNVIDPARVVHNDRRPPVVLTSFQLFSEPVVPGAKGSPLSASISETRAVRLERDQTVIMIGFAALDFNDPQKNQYAYRLDPFDRGWINAGTSRTASYSHLPPGDYTFRVKGSNSDGVWNEEGASLHISVAPALWERTWVRVVILLALLGTLLIAALSARRRHAHLAAMNRQLTEAAERDLRTQQYLEGNVLEILEAMQHFSTGDYSVALRVSSEDAIGKLRRGFNAVVADRKHTEEQLRQSQKMEAVGRLAGGVAHDFNNLLTVIKGNIELALQDIPDDAEVRAELRDAQQAAERAAMLTRQLLAFSRKQILQPQTLSLNALVTDVARMLQRTLGEHIELQTVLDPTNGTIRADPGQVQQVILNLVVNARDAMPRGGSLTIDARPATEIELSSHAEASPGRPYMVLSVRDTGEGIPPALVERIFEPFFTTKEQGKGTGLGLSTVYGIVSQSGGYLRVQSEVGIGSTFSVYLPLVEEAPAAAAPRTVPANTGESETILLAEDEEAVRLLSARVLRRAGFHVLTASHGREAMEVSTAFPGEIHLLLTDVIMPGMSGRELAQQLMPLRPSMRLLYVSGYTEDETVRHGVSGLGTAFLEKPFTPDTLVRKIREVLAHPAPVATG